MNVEDMYDYKMIEAHLGDVTALLKQALAAGSIARIIELQAAISHIKDWKCEALLRRAV